VASETTSTTWPAAALAKIALLEDALLVSLERAKQLEAERDRVRAAYQQALIALELLRRRIFAAKAERVDTAQLELEFEAKCKELDALAGELGGEPPPEAPPGGPSRRKPTGRRDLSDCDDLEEERVEIPDPELERLVAEGRAERFGFDEESSSVKWRRGGAVRLVMLRVKYRLGKLEGIASTADTAPSALFAAPSASPAAPSASPAAPSASATEVVIAATPSDDDAVCDEAGDDALATAATAAIAATAAVTAITATAAIAEVMTTKDVAASSGSRLDRSAGTTLVTATMPPLILPRAMGSPSLYAHIVHEKFRRGLPLFRQEQQLALDGFPLGRGTMSRWLHELGEKSSGVVDAMRADAKATAFCLATDATRILVQPAPRADGKRQACRTGHFFAVIADRDHVFFEYTAKENSKSVMRIFRGFEGYIQADANSVYDILFRAPDEKRPLTDDPELEPDGATRLEVGCWSHGRRGFYECAVTSKDAVAREALLRLHRLFEYEAKWRKLTPTQRKELRDCFSKPELESFFTWVELEYCKVEHQRGLLRTALGYARRHKHALMRYLDDGRLEMDNNRTEREIKTGVVLGRKAWLFIGSDDHGETTANLLSLIASARLHGLDDEAYLRDLFRVLPFWPEHRLLELAPKSWRATRDRLVPAELEQEIGWLTVPSAPAPAPPPSATDDAAR